jgi:Holliday junction resolvase
LQFLTDLIMAQNKESKLWNELKDLNKNWHFTRVESSTINGIPDVHCVVNKQIFWLELKANTHKNLGMSKWQINWHIKYQKAGGKVFILNRPLLQSDYEIWSVCREARVPTHVSSATNLGLLMELLASRISWQQDADAHSHSRSPRSVERTK